MILYHGSNVNVTNPKVLVSRRTLDFGFGFYTTSNYEQAVRWAVLKEKRQGNGRATVSIFELEETCFSSLHLLNFESATREWLDYVAQNRKGTYKGEQYDLVIGPVANDITLSVINDYITGIIDTETALILLKPQNLSDQYAFLTQNALDSLKWKEVRLV